MSIVLSKLDANCEHGVFEDAHNSALDTDSLIEKICAETDIPALGDSISEIVRLILSNEGSVQKLADLIISNVALTKKILNLSNSAVFRTAASQEVTSITVAIQLLGLETIKTCALAIILVDALSDKQVPYVRIELSRALMASVAGRELAKNSQFKNVEEITIVALFKNIGRLLIAAYDAKLYKEIMVLIREGGCSASKASLQVLGFSFDALARRAMKSWQIPESIIQAMQFIPAKVLTQPKSRIEWMQQAAELSESVTTHIFEADTSNEKASADHLVKRFGQSLNINQEKLDTLIEQTTEASVLLGEDDLHTLRSMIVAEHKRYPSGKPYNAHARLAEGVKNVEALIASSCDIGQLIQLVIKVIHYSLGVRFTTMCLINAKTNQCHARSSLGKDALHYQQGFIFPVASADDLFNLAMQKNIDLLIPDLSDKKIQPLIPRWYARLMPDANSLAVLPLVIDGKPVGLLYFDSHTVAPEGLSSAEMHLLRTLKQLVMTVMNSK